MLTQLPNNVPVIIANDSKHSYANQEINHLLPQAVDSESAIPSSFSYQTWKIVFNRVNPNISICIYVIKINGLFSLKNSCEDSTIILVFITINGTININHKSTYNVHL